MKTPKTQQWRQLVDAGAVPVLEVRCEGNAGRCGRHVGNVVQLDGHLAYYAEVAWANRDDYAGNEQWRARRAGREPIINAVGPWLYFQCSDCGDVNCRRAEVDEAVKAGRKLLTVVPMLQVRSTRSDTV